MMELVPDAEAIEAMKAAPQRREIGRNTPAPRAFTATQQMTRFSHHGPKNLAKMKSLRMAPRILTMPSQACAPRCGGQPPIVKSRLDLMFEELCGNLGDDGVMKAA
jgi:hypothetical protein